MHTYHIVFALNNDPTHYWCDVPAYDQKDAIRAWNEIRRVIPGRPPAFMWLGTIPGTFIGMTV